MPNTPTDENTNASTSFVWELASDVTTVTTVPSAFSEQTTKGMWCREFIAEIPVAFGESGASDKDTNDDVSIQLELVGDIRLPFATGPSTGRKMQYILAGCRRATNKTKLDHHR